MVHEPVLRRTRQSLTKKRNFLKESYTGVGKTAQNLASRLVPELAFKPRFSLLLKSYGCCEVQHEM